MQQAFVVRPQLRTSGQLHRREQVRIYVSNPAPKQRMTIDEMQDFGVSGHDGAGQIRQGREDRVAPPQIAQRQFANHGRVRQNLPAVEQVSQSSIAGAQMADPYIIL